MTEKLTAYFIGDNKPVAVWPVEWRLSMSRHPGEWRRGPWSDDEVAAYRAAAPQRAAAEREASMREFLIGQSGVGSPMARFERDRALRYEAALKAEVERRLAAVVQK